MIQQLLSNIITELEGELAEHSPKADILAIPLTKPIDKKLPQIAIYPGELTISQKFKDPSSTQLQNQEIVQEFQQELLIDICDQDLAKIEKLASLTAGIILTNQEQLIQNYNSQKTATKYSSKTISNTHTISQINFLGGIYSNLVTPFVFQLKFEVFGQLKLAKNVVEEVSVIKDIELTSSRR